MANLYTKVKKYLEANSKTWDNIKVSLQNDGSGDYIKSWSYDIAEPTDEQLATYESSATTEENNNVIRRTRKSAYGDYGDQLDEIFKNIDDWKTRIQSIKDANPKE
mgnify:CR=1 FL=1|tara:strand:+ start:638 stop:955 length:318 start_codon:yes stop_codon:yes gene_type:complete